SYPQERRPITPSKCQKRTNGSAAKLLLDRLLHLEKNPRLGLACWGGPVLTSYPDGPAAGLAHSVALRLTRRPASHRVGRDPAEFWSNQEDHGLYRRSA